MTTAGGACRGRGRCRHPMILIAVDPNDTEIWRCPQCQPTGMKPWRLPFFDLSKTFRDAKPGDNDDSPWHENAVRELEDAGGCA